MKINKYWLNADPTDEENIETPEQKALREKLEQAILDKLTTQFGDTIKGYEDKIKSLEEKIKTPEVIIPKEEEKKKEEEIDLTKITDPTILKILENVQNQSKVLESQNVVFLNQKKDELKKKYNLKDEDIQDIKSLEDLAVYDKIFEKSFEVAKGVYLSDEKIAEELKKKKKMIVALDPSALGEEAKKQKQDEITKSIFSIFNKK